MFQVGITGTYVVRRWVGEEERVLDRDDTDFSSGFLL
jgi:hypothetical protein